MLYAIGAGPFRTKFGKFCVRFVVNNYIDKKMKEGRKFINKINIKEKK